MSRPFNQKRYTALLEGLEISEVGYAAAMASAETHRIDPEYFQKQHLTDALHAKNAAHKFVTFESLGLRVDGSAFYPGIEGNYGNGDLPFLRVADVDSIIDFEGCVRIPDELCERYKTLSRVYPGDILFTKGGSIARIGLVTQEAAASRDLIFINSAQLSEADRTFIYLYFQTGFFNRMLVRSSSMTAQPHLTITLVRHLPVFLGSPEFKLKCVELVKESYRQKAQATNQQAAAEQTLLRVLGLEGWQPPEPLTYIRKASEALEANRLDAEFYFPKYEALRSFLASKFEVSTLKQLGQVLKGSSVAYDEAGTVPIIRSGDLSDISDDDRFKRSLPGEDITDLEPGDVLISSIGFGSIGKVQVFNKAGRFGTVSEVTIVRQNQINPYYLNYFLRSKAGQTQISQFITGATGQLHLYPRDVAKIVVPIIPEKQQKDFEIFARSAHTARQTARELLDRAKRAVEIAIEQGEAAALKLLSQA